MKPRIAVISLLILIILALTVSQALADKPVDKKVHAPPGQSVDLPDQAGDKPPKKDKHNPAGAPEGYPGPEQHGKPEKDAKPDKESKPEKDQENKPDKSLKKQNLRGTIVSFDGVTLVIELKNGEQVRITVTDGETNVRFPGLAEADLLPGMQVMVHARPGADGADLSALAVQVIPGKPTRLHRVGVVTEYIPGVSITIEGKHGATTFALEGAAFVNGMGEDIVVGETTVTIISPRDVTAAPSSTPAAKGVVIH